MRATKHSMSAFASLLVAVFAANWLATPFLFTRHEHTWCEAHQQFEHLQHHDSADGASYSGHDCDSQAAGYDQPPDNNAHLKPKPDGHSSAHEACHVLAQLNHKTTTPRNPVESYCVDTPDAQLRLTRLAVFPSHSKLLFAPKNSPPTV